MESLELSELCLERQPPDAVTAAQVWAVHGSALRVVGRMREADRALARATADLEGLPAEDAAEIRTHLALLRRDQERFEEAVGLMTEVIHYRRVAGIEPDLHRFGLSLMARSTIHHMAGDLSAAIEDAGLALKHIQPEQSPENHAAAIHNLATYLQESNRSDDLRTAARYIKKALQVGRFPRGSVPRAKLYWLTGLIDLRIGMQSHAERVLQIARETLIEREMPYEVAMISLDLGGLYLEEGDFAALERLAVEAYDLLSTQGAPVQATAAFGLWHRAVLARELTESQHKEIRARLWAGTRRERSDAIARPSLAPPAQ